MNKLEKFNVFSITLLLTVTQLLFSNNYITIFCMLLLILCFALNYKKNKSKINKKFFFFIIIGCIISILLPLYNPLFIKNISSTLLVWGTILLLFLIIATQETKEDIFLKVFKYFSYITIFLIIYGLIIYCFGNKSISYDLISNSYYQELNIGGIRLIQSAVGDIKYGHFVGSLTGNPNTLSFMSIFSITYFLIIDNSKKSKRLLNIIICILGLLISGSRLGFVLLLLILLLDFALKKIDFSNKKNTLGLLFVFMLIVLAISFNFNNIFTGIDLNGRNIMWEIGKNNIELIGHGINSDNIYIHNYLNTYSSMHNSYISLLVNYGIIISSFVILFFITTLINSLKYSHINDINRFIVIIYISLLIIGLSESVFLIFGYLNSLFFYIIYYYYLNVRRVK